MARNAFAATFTISAVAGSVTRKGIPAASGSAYTSRSVASARSDQTPATIRSGRSVSSTAWPSLRNSGFQASSAPGPAGAAAGSRLAVGHHGARRHRRLPDDEAGPPQQRGQPGEARLELGEIRAAGSGALRGSHADEVHVAELRGGRVGRGEREPAARSPARSSGSRPGS